MTFWPDDSGNTAHDMHRTTTSGTTYSEEGIDGRPSVRFDQGRLCTAEEVPPPQHGQVSVMILFSKSHKTSWEQLIGQGHDRYWSVRQLLHTRATMQEGRYRSARTSAEYPLNTDLLLVGTIEGDGNRKIWMYDMAGDLVTSGAEDYYASNTLIPSSKTGSSPGHDSGSV